MLLKTQYDISNDLLEMYLTCALVLVRSLYCIQAYMNIE